MLSMLVGGCVHAPTSAEDRYEITEAHAVRANTLGPFSYLTASSFVSGNQRDEARFPSDPVLRTTGQVPVTVRASRKEIDIGFDRGIAVVLASSAGQMLGGLSVYLGKPVPVRELEIELVSPTERIERHSRSLTFIRRHRVKFSFTFDPKNAEQSSRAIVRTFAHELFHLSLSVYGRRIPPGLTEERAASTLEHCVEADVFGSTPPPRRLSFSKYSTTEIGYSLEAGYAHDAELDPLFLKGQSIRERDAGALKRLCLERVWDVAGWNLPSQAGPLSH